MRITRADLENTVDRINKATNSPLAAYTKTEDGYKANPGNYHLDWAYGGCKLVRMCNDGGGINEITHGFDSKADLYYQMRAYLQGILDTKAS